MSTHIYTREESKKLIDELEIISYKKQIHLCKTKITVSLMESILFHTAKCNDRLSERIYWILNDIEDYPNCKHCGKYFKPRFYGIGGNYNGNNFCSPKCSTSNVDTQEKMQLTNEERHGVKHILQSEKSKEKYRQTCKERYNVENPNQSKEILEKRKKTCKERYNVEWVLSSKQIREKGKQTCFNNHGVEHPMQSKEIQEKCKQTCLERYDAEYTFQSKQIQEKGKKTLKEHYNVENPAQSPEILAKIQTTCKERYGHNNIWGSEIGKQKIKETNIIKYDAEYPMRSEQIKEKSRQTCLERYDATHPMKNKDFFSKHEKAIAKRKELILPSGQIAIYQGYENVAINKLLSDGYLEEQIILERKLIPSFNYNFNEKNKTYYPDLYIPHQNLIIEVKSTWTYSKDLEQNLTKRQACIDAGYRFEFWICSDKEVLEIR